MAFNGYLGTEQLQEITKAAVDGDLVFTDRQLLLRGIRKSFALGLPKASSPLDQIQQDLTRLNDVERLEGGQIPLVQFLENAAFQLKLQERKEAEVFERYANRINNSAGGLATLPDPKLLPEVVKKEAILGFDETLDFVFLATGASMGRSVARLLVPRFENGVAVNNQSGGPWVMLGTGWLIGPKMVLTNHHVINARRSEEPDAAAADLDRQARQSTAEFDFDTGKNPVPVQVDSLIVSSTNLDYALLRLVDDAGRQPLRLLDGLVTMTAATRLPLNIIQHPRGQTKRIAFRNNLLTGADAETVRYFTDTDFGSSGAPVFDDGWRVVALHRGACFVDDIQYQGKSSGYVNFGSQIQAILEDIRKQSPAVHTELMQAQQNLPPA